MRGLGGFALLAVLGISLNFAVPITPALSTGAAAAGVLLFVRGRRRILSGLTRGELAGGLLLAVLVSVFASQPLLHYDTGLYHLQAIGWMEDGPVPLGLANLHRRLGLNSSWLGAAALLQSPLGITGPLLASGLLVFFLLTAVALAAKHTRDGTPEVSRVFLVLAAVPCAVAVVDRTLPSTSTDLPVTVLAIVAAALLTRGLETGRLALEAPVLIALAVFAVTVKLSAAPLLLFAAAALIHSGAPGQRLSAALRLLAVSVVPALLLLGPWTARGLLLTGRLFYPLPLGAVGPFPWAVPEEMRAEEVRAAAEWARSVSGGPAIVVMALLAALGIALLLFGRRRPFPRPPLPALVLSAAGVVFWLATAPDPRFGFGHFFSFAGLLLAMGLVRSGLLDGRFGNAVLVVLLTAPAVAAAGLLVVRVGLARPSLLGTRPLPQPSLATRVTEQGERILVPAAGDRCFAAPRPCTPFFRPDLVIVRSSGRIVELRR